MPRFWWMYLGFRRLIIGFVALVLIIVALISVGVVPPISGRVVDAMSGKPVAGMDVCLEATVIDFATREVVRSEVTRSDALGEFSFSYSIHRTEGFRRWEGYSIRVTDPNAEMVETCGDIPGVAFSNFSVQIDEGRTWAPIHSGRPVYFPVAFVRAVPNRIPFGPLRQKMEHLRGGEIALIPLLQNAGECQGIRDSSLAPFCSEMNNSAVASVMRKDIQQAAGTQ
jgi:hypothetical protein